MQTKLIYVVAALVAGFLGAYTAMDNREDFRTLDGKSYNWLNLKGQWLVVNYFAEWCGPCIKEIPELNAFSEFAQQRQDVSLFAVNFDLMKLQETQIMAERLNIQFPLMQYAPARAPFGKPKGLPATYIISPNGELVATLKGEQTNQGLQKIIEQLIESQ